MTPQAEKKTSAAYWEALAKEHARANTPDHDLMATSKWYGSRYRVALKNEQMLMEIETNLKEKSE